MSNTLGGDYFFMMYIIIAARFNLQIVLIHINLKLALMFSH